MAMKEVKRFQLNDLQVRKKFILILYAINSV